MRDGNRAIVKAICRSSLGRGFTRDEWFCEAPVIDLDEVDPLIDYIANRRRRDAGFSMKGRTPKSLTRAMEEWHRDLARARKVENIVFKKSGIAEGFWKFPAKTPVGQPATVTWSIREILISQDLVNEGRLMSHCVYSYAYRVRDGIVSIRFLRRNRQRCLIVEARNETREIVRARGRYNHRGEPTELNKLKRRPSKASLRLRVR